MNTTQPKIESLSVEIIPVNFSELHPEKKDGLHITETTEYKAEKEREWEGIKNRMYDNDRFSRNEQLNS